MDKVYYLYSMYYVCLLQIFPCDHLSNGRQMDFIEDFLVREVTFIKTALPADFSQI